MIRRLLATLALMGASAVSQSAVVNAADVGGFRTFQDTNTGLIWADLDNWLQANTGAAPAMAFASYADYLAGLQAAGFVWATTTEVDDMLSSMPMNGAPGSLARSVISTDWSGTIESWAGYSDLGSTVGGLPQVTRHQIGFGVLGPTWNNTGPLGVDFATISAVGLFAYIPSAPGGGGTVPEPGTLALVGVALATAGLRRRTQKPSRA